MEEKECSADTVHVYASVHVLQFFERQGFVGIRYVVRPNQSAKQYYQNPYHGTKMKLNRNRFSRFFLSNIEIVLHFLFILVDLHL